MHDRCQYLYDAFGNLHQKNCTSGVRQYIIDPFGAYGASIIAEVFKMGTKWDIHSVSNISHIVYACSITYFG